MATQTPRAVARRLSTLSERTAADIRRRVVDSLLEAAEAAVALFYTLHVDEAGERRVSAAVATDPRAVDALVGIAKDTARYLPLLDTRTPSSLQRRAFLPECETFDLDQWHRSPVFQEVYRPLALGSQQRLLIYDGGRFVGWLGFFREQGDRPFTSSDRRRVAPLVRPCSEALIAADRLERGAFPEAVGDLLVSATGAVLLASAQGRQWLSVAGFRDRVADAVRRFDRGEDGLFHVVGVVAGITRLESDDLGVAYAVRLTRAAPVRLSALAALLSPRQLEVATLAAGGHSRDQIALALDVGLETVREHLREVYLRLGVSTRAELAGRMAQADADA